MRKLMRRLKWVVVGLFAVVVALAVAAYAIVTNYPVEDLKALIQDEVKTATGRKLAIDGTVEMQVLPSPAIVMEGVRLENAPWGAAPDMVTLGHVEAEVAFWPLINGDIEVRRLLLSDASVSLERTAEGEANWHMGERGGGSGSLPHFAAVKIERAKVTLDDRQHELAGTLTLAELGLVAPDLAGPMAVTLTGALDELPLDLELTLPAAPALVEGGVQPVEIAGRVGDATLQLAGKIGPWESGANDFRVSVQGKDLQVFAPELPAGHFQLEAQVQQRDPATVALSSLKGMLAGAAFDGSLTLSTAQPVPRLEGELHLGKLVLPAGKGGDTSGALFPAAPLPFEYLREANAKLVLTVDQLNSGTRLVLDLATRIALEDGKLSLDPLGFSYGGGTFTGQLAIDASAMPPTTSLSLAGSGLPLGVATDGVLNGSLEVDVELAAVGDSPKAMAASLDGRSTISSGSGTIDSELASIASAPLAAILRPLVGGGGQSKMNCLVNRMAWQDGIGTNQGTALDAEDFTVIGNGTVDLKSETIDFYVDSRSKETALVGLAVPMVVRGPLTKPSVTPDPAGTALGLAKTAGLIVFPPAGLAAIIGDRAVSGDGNACVAAVDKVEEEGGPLSFFEEAGSAISDTVESIGEGAGDTFDAIGEGAKDAVEGLKGLFSN
ncbi:MAG TPA: AsmA family protein [Kiloniellales bacterium]|nr:AsmA family protein [Kiloniellales bacterium]